MPSNPSKPFASRVVARARGVDVDVGVGVGVERAFRDAVAVARASARTSRSARMTLRTVIDAASFSRRARVRLGRDRDAEEEEEDARVVAETSRRRAMSFRRRGAVKKTPGEEDAADGAEENETTTTTTTTTSKGKKKLRGANASASLLSFEDDGGADDDPDEGGASLLKSKAKSAAERRRRKARGIDVSRVVAASERSVGTASAAHATRTYDAAALRALASEQTTTRDRPEEHAAGRSAEDVFGRKGGADASEEWRPPPPPRDGGAVGGTVIPDAAAIAEAKAKREAARLKAAGRSVAPDYIDLDSRGGADERVSFKSVRGTSGDRFAGYVEGDVLAGSDGEDEFERAQLQRVFKDEPDMKRHVRSAHATMKQSGESVSIEQGGLDAFESLKRALEAAESSSATARKESMRADENMVRSEEALVFYEKELKSASERYVYTQKLRDYFRDACAMLNDKKLILEELEEHYKKIHAARAKSLTDAINAEFEESAIEAEAAANAINAVLQSGGTQEQAKTAAAMAVQSAVSEAKGLHLEKLDDMGRDVNILLREQVKSRSKRREEDASLCVKEDEREIELFHKDWSDARDAAGAMFKDASEEFSTLGAVKKHAEEWKRTHASSYKSTYMSISAPNLFAPFARLELIGWSPLFPRTGETSPATLDTMSWYSQVFDYGATDGAFEDGDADANLLPKLVEHIVVPIVAEAVESWWDPRDSSQSRALASTLRDVFVYVEPSANEEAKELVMTVQRRLKKAAEECSIPTYSPIVTAAAPNVARHAAARLSLALGVAESARAFIDILDRAALQRIVADAIIATNVIPYARLQLITPETCVSTLRDVVDALPVEWRRASPPGIAPLRELITALDRAFALARPDPSIERMFDDLKRALGA